MDVKIAFLNGILTKEIYIIQPPRYEKFGEKHKVCHLLQIVDGLKQAPHKWYERFTTYIFQVIFI
jgi:hypothetical protein